MMECGAKVSSTVEENTNGPTRIPSKALLLRETEMDTGLYSMLMGIVTKEHGKITSRKDRGFFIHY